MKVMTMPVIRRRRKSVHPPLPEMTAEEMVALVAGLMGATPMGRAQKTKGNRYDFTLPGGERGEVKYTNGHSYRRGGFRDGVSNLFGLGKDENDGEYFFIVGRRKISRPDLVGLDAAFFFLFFSRSQLLEICPRAGMLNLPVNWEPGGKQPKYRCDTVQRNAAICRAVVSVNDLRHVMALVANNPNDPSAVARPKVRNTMSRLEREKALADERIRELEIQLKEARSRRGAVTSVPAELRSLFERRISLRRARRPTPAEYSPRGTSIITH